MRGSGLTFCLHKRPLSRSDCPSVHCLSAESEGEGGSEHGACSVQLGEEEAQAPLIGHFVLASQPSPDAASSPLFGDVALFPPQWRRSICSICSTSAGLYVSHAEGLLRWVSVVCVCRPNKITSREQQSCISQLPGFARMMVAYGASRARGRAVTCLARISQRSGRPTGRPGGAVQATTRLVFFVVLGAAVVHSRLFGIIADETNPPSFLYGH